MRTSSRNVVVMLYDEVELLDVAGMVETLSWAGRQWNWRPFRILCAARQAGPVQTNNQLTLIADHAFDNCPKPEILVVPGGYGARKALSDGTTLEFVRRHAGELTHACAIGHGVLLLEKAGLLSSKRVAASDTSRALLEDPSVVEEGSAIVGEDAVFTARGSSDSVALGLRLVADVLGPKQMRQVAEAIGHPLDESAPPPITIA